MNVEFCFSEIKFFFVQNSTCILESEPSIKGSKLLLKLVLFCSLISKFFAAKNAFVPIDPILIIFVALQFFTLEK